jgi:hypothetical protein
MALIAMAGGFSAIIGKLNGSVFQRRGSLVLLRNNKNWNRNTSSAWQKEKALVANVSATWRTLSAANKAAWEAMAPSYPTTDPFGSPRDPSGYELYMRLNLSLRFVGVASLTTPIAPIAITNVGAVTLTNGGAVQLHANWSNSVTADEYVCLFSQVQTSTGRATKQGGWCYMARQEDDTIQTLEFTTEYIARYAALISGMKYNLKLQVINILSGQIGVPSYATLTMP